MLRSSSERIGRCSLGRLVILDAVSPSRLGTQTVAVPLGVQPQVKGSVRGSSKSGNRPEELRVHKMRGNTIATKGQSVARYCYEENKPRDYETV